MSASIKQQSLSPVPYDSFTNDLYHHYRSSTSTGENDELTSTGNNPMESSSAMLLHDSERGSVSHEDKRQCAVCSDVASGYHYGVWSCEGCKAFFKRSIQGTNDYICPATNTCTIDKHRRKSCQACRLRRCYEVGMTKGTARRERKYRKKAVSVCKITSTSSHSNGTSNKPDQTQALSTAHDRLSAATPCTSQPNPTTSNNSNTFASPQSLQTAKSTPEPARSTIKTHEFLMTLSQASRLNLPAKIDPNRPLDDQYFLQLLAKIFDQELVVLINWAKAIPGYTETLTLDQQVTMIEHSWLDTLILDIIERSHERNDDSLQFAPDVIIPRQRELSSPILSSICTYLLNILQVFKDSRATHDEFIALKATILINSIPATISSTKAFRILTNQIYQTVQYTCDANPSVYQDNSLRHFTLLLQLPHIKMLSTKLMKLFLDMRNNDMLPQADLLLEMLEAQDACDVSFTMEIDNLSSQTKTYNQNSTLPLSPFAIENPPIYSNQYSAATSDTGHLPTLNEKRSSSAPILSQFDHANTISPANSKHILTDESSF
ncbi:unnamed protein product [Adineta ricciae]|uniref:Estrogen receptor n=1 Tax=Adineta ricciae TaxID=249248 RepID=A0A815MYT0_ADIRI|nr:unnamed protein product [Adineta ricciae]